MTENITDPPGTIEPVALPPGATPCTECGGTGYSEAPGTDYDPGRLCRACEGEGRLTRKVKHWVEVWVDGNGLASQLICVDPAQCKNGYYDRRAGKEGWACYTKDWMSDWALGDLLDYPDWVQPLVGRLEVSVETEGYDEDTEVFLRPTEEQQKVFASAKCQDTTAHLSHQHDAEIHGRTTKIYCPGLAPRCKDDPDRVMHRDFVRNGWVCPTHLDEFVSAEDEFVSAERDQP